MPLSLNADETALKTGESIGFAADDTGWPMELTVYGDLEGKQSIASLTIPRAAVEGERWFVCLEQGERGLYLRCTTAWPLEEQGRR